MVAQHTDEGVETRKSARIGGEKLSAKVLSKTPPRVSVQKRSQQPAAGSKRGADESKAEKRARLLAELEELEASEEEVSSDGDARREAEVDAIAAQIERDVELERGLAARDAKLRELRAQAKQQESAPTKTAEESRSRRPRLAPPREFRGEKGKYRGWQRLVGQWREAHADVSDSVAGQQLLEALKGDVEDIVVGSLGDEELSSYQAIMKVLESSYGQETLLESIDVEQELKRYTRKNEGLKEFLAKFEALRAKAKRHGYAPSALTEGTELLSKAGISTEQKAAILQQLAHEAALTGKDPATVGYPEVLRSLQAIARAHELCEQEKEEKPRKEKPAYVAMPKGKWGQPKGKWTDKTKGTQDGKGSGDGKAGAAAGVCWFNLQGKCWKGASCKFSHSQPKGESATKGGKGDGKGNQGKGPQWREGDWKCPKCGDHQFSKNTKCRKCGEGKPTGGSGK
jgi:hypothetical protein